MRRIGKYQFRMRTLLGIPLIVACTWWLVIQALEIDWGASEDQISVRLVYHEEKALHYQEVAQSKIQEYSEGWAMDMNDHCSPVKIPLSAAEIEQQKLYRLHAARRAAYHSAMKEKYAWAARFPWLPIMKDPPEP